MSPRSLKVVRDLLSDKLKSLLMVAAIAVGVFGVGTVLGAYAILDREIDRNYLGTHPADATVVVEDALDGEALGAARRVPGVTAVEARSILTARMRVGDGWQRMLLFVVPDFEGMRIATFDRVSGAWPPPPGTMLVERTSLEVMHAAQGASVTVKLPEGAPRAVTIAGVVHDPSLAPSRQEQTGYAYVTPETVRLLGGTGALDQLRIRTPFTSMPEVTRVAQAAAGALTAQGHQVHELRIPPLGQHPHSSQMRAILALLMVFAALLLVLSGVLVTSSISVLMLRQVREIGVMKTVGARTGQIARMYFSFVFLLAAAGTVVAVPLGVLAAGAYAQKVGQLLNFAIVDAGVPAWVLAVEIAAGLLVPLAIAARSVWRGSRVSVREAITDYGVRQDLPSSPRLERLVARLRGFGATATVSLRNLLRSRSRLMVALTLLGAAGAMFTSALNLSKAWDRNLDRVLEQRRFDLEIQLARPIDPASLAAAIGAIDGVSAVEAWSQTPTALATPGSFEVSRVYPDKGHGAFTLVGVPDDTRMIALPVLRGAWLAPGDGDGVVLNHNIAARIPNARIGDTVLLSVDGVPTRWRLAGVVEEDFGGMKAYVASAAFARVTHTQGTADVLRVGLARHEARTLATATRAIERELSRQDAPVTLVMASGTFRNAVAEHMGVLVGILLAMGALMGIVGVLGLGSTVSMNILERTRELGVLRAVGATPARVFRMLLVEGLAIGLFSVPLAVLLALPFTYVVGDVVGRMAFLTPLPLTLSPPALLGWIAIVLIGSILATTYPAWKAARMSVREALAYE